MKYCSITETFQRFRTFERLDDYTLWTDTNEHS